MYHEDYNEHTKRSASGSYFPKWSRFSNDGGDFGITGIDQKKRLEKLASMQGSEAIQLTNVEMKKMRSR